MGRFTFAGWTWPGGTVGGAFLLTVFTCFGERAAAYGGTVYPRYHLIQIGDVDESPGGDRSSYSQVLDLNDAGQILATDWVYPPNGSLRYREFVWQNGHRTYTNPLKTYKTAINNAGVSSGGRRLSDGQGTLPIVVRDGNVVDLAVPKPKPTAFYSRSSTDINNHDVAVGYSFEFKTDGTAQTPQSFIWRNTQNPGPGDYEDIGSLGGQSTFAYHINDREQVIGASQIKSGEEHAFFWENGKMTDIGTLSPGDTSSVTGINNAGVVIGASQYTMSYSDRGFVWSNGNLTELHGLAGSVSAVAGAINDHGDMVGTSFFADKDVLTIWRDGNAMNLSTFASGIADWSGVVFTGFNDERDIIGNGYYNGHSRGFLLTTRPMAVPLPSPFWLGLAGFAMADCAKKLLPRASRA